MRIVHSMENCLGCKACVSACKDVNNMPPYKNLLRVETTERVQEALGGDTPQEVQVLFQVRTCLQCKEPRCMEACPMKAIEKREDGSVSVAREKCIGCGKCTGCCPVQAVVLVNRKAKKCELCRTRKEGPACIEACPNHCLIMR